MKTIKHLFLESFSQTICNASSIFFKTLVVLFLIAPLSMVGQKTSATSGDWNSSSTWSPSGVPSSTDVVTIGSGHVVYTNATLVRNANTTVNGTFELRDGGWVNNTSSGTMSYSGSGTLNFNLSSGSYGVSSDAKFWPTTNGPYNINVLNAGMNLQAGASRTVNGVFSTKNAGSSDVYFPSGTTLTINGTCRIDNGGKFSASDSTPTYGASSTLSYNGVTSYNVGNEWKGNSTTAGVGVPNNVTVTSSSSVTMPNSNRGLAGNLTINASSTLNLNAGSGDLYLAGNWVNAGAFNANNRAVFFNGTAVQTVSNSNAASFNTENFSYLIIDKSTTNALKLNSNININATSGGVLQLNNIGGIDLNGKTVTFNNDNGDLSVSGGVRTITSSIAGGVITILGNKTVVSSSGGTLVLDTNTSTVLKAGLNFGYNLTTINGTLEIKAPGFVETNAPFYSATSRLIYNGGGIYGRGTEWGTLSGAGFPNEVQISNETTLNYPNAGSFGAGPFSAPMAIAKNLIIDENSSFYMGYGDNANKSGKLTIGGDLTLNGNLGLGNAYGGDLYIAGNWTKSGTANFYPNDRSVFFNGTAVQQINSATTFDYLHVDKTANYVELKANVSVSKNLLLANNNLVLGNFNLTLPNKTSTITANTGSYITATGTGQLIRQGIDGTSDWIFPVGVLNTGRYAPITIKSLSGTTEIGVRASATFTPSVADLSKVIKTEWFVSSTNSITATIAPEWQTAELGASMGTLPATGEFGKSINGGLYSLQTITVGTNSTEATGVSISNTGTHGFVVGLTDALKVPNDECVDAITLTVNGGTTCTVTTAGNFQGATQSIAPITCVYEANIALDLWYKFTATATTHTVSVTPTSTFDVVLDVRSGSCTGTSIGCSDNNPSSTNPETVTLNSLTIGAVYYVRVYPFSGGNNTTSKPFTICVTTVPDIYRSKQSGSWGATTSWQSSSDGVNWANATAAPSNTANTILIRNTHEITVNTNTTADQVTVEAGGIVTIDNSKTLTVNDGVGVDLEVNGTLNVNGGLIGGTLTQNAGSTTVFNANSFYNHKRNSGTIPTASWDATSTCTVTGMVATVPTISSFNQTFGNFTWNCSSQSSPVNFTSAAYGFGAAGAFTLQHSGTSLFCLSSDSGTSNTFNFGSIVVGASGKLQNSAKSSTAAGLIDLNVLGNVTVNGIMDFGAGTADAITGTYRSRLFIKGNLEVASGATFYKSGSNSSFGKVEFNNATVPQTLLNNSTATYAMNFEVNAASKLTLLSDVSLNGSSGFLNYGILDLGTFEVKSTVATNTFNSYAASTLMTKHAAGIATLPSSTGAVQVNSGSYATAATYIYNGTGNQITGTGLPATVSGLTINNSGTTPTNEVTLTNAIAVTQLTVTAGVFNLNAKSTTGTLLNVANEATLKIVGTDTFPLFTLNTLPTNSIVEYGGANQTIAALTAPTYGKLKVSGTGTKTLATTDVQVGNTLEVTSSLLSIEQDKTLTVTNGVTTSNDAISVANGGSLVQVTDVNNASANNNTGKIAVARITQPMYKFDYTYWSAPVGGTTLHDLSPDTPANRYFYWNPVVVSPAANWTVISGGTGTMSAGKGYIIRAPSSYGADPTLLASYTAYSGSFSGVPNNGTVSVDVSGSDTVDVWNLVGNPYPSAIDASAFLDANVGGTNDILGGTLYFWTHNTPYGTGTTYAYSTADYATWNGTGETATTDDTVSNNTNTPSGKIAAAQAFFVRGTANGTAVFKNTMREKGNNMQFFRGAATAETTTTVEKNRVWLNLKGANNAFSQTLVGYVTNATNDYDVRYDGESFGGNFVTFYSVNNAKHLVSQGRALPFVTTDEVPLGYKATGTGNLTIAIDHTDGVLATQAIYLKDNLLNVVHNLTESAYTFASVAGTFDERFVLRYLPAVELANPTFNEALNGVTIRKNDATLRINSPYETIDQVQVYDITGRLVFEQKDCNTNTFEASHIVYSEQTLIVKVRLSNGGVVTKKVL